MKKLYIHIGMPKTATTHLQVRQQRTKSEDLSPFFVSLPKRLRFAPPSIRMHILPLLLKMEDTRMMAETLDHFCEWLDSGPSQIRLYCSEMLCQTPSFDKGHMDWMFERLNRQFELHWIVVLRPYFSWLESFINQNTKTGYTQFDLLLADPKRAFGAWQMDYSALLEDYAPYVAGGDRLHVFRYGPDVNENILDLTQLRFRPADEHGRNKSPSPFSAFRLFLETKGFDQSYLPDNRSLRFVAKDEVMAWAPAMQAWAHPLAERLGWPVHWIDDSAQVLARREPYSLLTHVAQFPDLLAAR